MTINPDPRWNRQQNEGVTPSGSGLRPFGAEPQDASQAKPLVPNAFAELALRCESAAAADRKLDGAIAEALGLPHGRESGWCNNEVGDYYVTDECAKPFTASVDAALSLLDAKNDWRRLTPSTVSVYAASPYNSAAQVRYDGFGATIPLQVCAAVFKMRAAAEAKAIAMEARRGETEDTGSTAEGGDSACAKHIAPIQP